MKAYYIGGIADQTKEIISDEPLKIARRAWVQGGLTVTINPEPRSEPAIIHYDEYECRVMPSAFDGKPIALYFYRGTTKP
jgi:hypothetical protein